MGWRLLHLVPMMLYILVSLGMPAMLFSPHASPIAGMKHSTDPHAVLTLCLCQPGCLPRTGQENGCSWCLHSVVPGEGSRLPPPPSPAGELSRDDSLRCSEGKGPRAAGRRDTAAGHRAEMLKDGIQTPQAESGCWVEGFWPPVGSLSLQLSPLRVACGLRGLGAGEVPSKPQPC